MLARSLGVFASLALAAHSVLIPPSIAGVDSLTSEEGWGSHHQLKYVADLECDSCPKAFKTRDGLGFMEQNETVYYTVSLSTENEALYVEDFRDYRALDLYQLYPPILTPTTLDGFHVEQRNNLHLPFQEEGRVPVTVTSYTFLFQDADTVSEDGYELLHMTLQIMAIEGRDVNPPAIDIYLIKDTEGRLKIASLKISKNIFADMKPHSKICEKLPLLCKWKSMLADKVNGLKSSAGKGCGKFKGRPQGIEGPPHGKLPGHLRPGFQHKPHFEQDGPHRPPHGHGHGHGHHRHGHGHHRVQKFFGRAFFTVVLPILVGIFAGTLTYLIGMALGCAIAIVIAKVRGQDRYISLPQDEEQNDGKAGDDSEKEVYSELPQYEAPPVYEEATEKEVVNEAH